MTNLIVKQIEDDKGYIKGYKTIRELVMCKDCKHYHQKPTPILDDILYGICMGISKDNKGVQIAVTSEHYCSLAERRET